MTLSLVAAVAENGVIGADGGLPWRLPADHAHFRRLTTGHTVIMGRRTFESIGRALPKRTCVVVTRDPEFAADGVLAARSLDAALALAAGDETAFVIGGAALYREALPRADRLDLTRVHAAPPGDTHFPEVDWSAWRLVAETRHEADARHACAFTIQRWERARA